MTEKQIEINTNTNQAIRAGKIKMLQTQTIVTENWILNLWYHRIPTTIQVTTSHLNVRFRKKSSFQGTFAKEKQKHILTIYICLQMRSFSALTAQKMENYLPLLEKKVSFSTDVLGNK